MLKVTLCLAMCSFYMYRRIEVKRGYKIVLRVAGPIVRRAVESTRTVARAAHWIFVPLPPEPAPVPVRANDPARQAQARVSCAHFNVATGGRFNVEEGTRPASENGYSMLADLKKIYGNTSLKPITRHGAGPHANSGGAARHAGSLRWIPCSAR